MSVKCLLSLHSKLSCRQTRDKNRSARRCKKKKKKALMVERKLKMFIYAAVGPLELRIQRVFQKKKQLELQTV